MATSQLFNEYDIIFAGGGATAGVVAGRLATANPSLRILILEMGPTVRDNPAHIQPGLFLTHLVPDSRTVKNVFSKPSEHLNGRQLPVQHGQCVGGGSSVNFMMYTRAPAADYDDWGRLYNNPGWSFHDLLPFIKKAESYGNVPDRPTHGYEGPLKISYGGALTSAGSDFIETVLRYDPTRTAVDDANSMIQDVNRIEAWPKWIDAETGHRSDVAHNYIYPALDKSKNVHLLPGSAVKRVVIEGGKATGVEFFFSPNLSDADATPHVVRASKLVVVSAGTFGSPSILERSGIGSKVILDRIGIEHAVELPGVGENYNDHPLMFIPFHSREDVDTYDGIVRGDPNELERWSVQWQQNRQGLLASNGIDAGFKLRPTEKELSAIGSEFTERWASYYASTPSRPILWCGQITQYVGLSPPPPTQKMYCVGLWSAHPVGTGSVHINSAHDVHAPYDFDAGVFSRKEDLAVMRFAWKLGREYGRRMSSYRGEHAPDRPMFPQGSRAAVSQDLRDPIAWDAPDIVYSKEDDEAIDNYLKQTIMTAWHSLGTCAMKPRDQHGVVDSRLNVYGVLNLKVADMSICPSNIATNTYSTAVMIGEKAAALIAQDLGLTEG